MSKLKNIINGYKNLIIEDKEFFDLYRDRKRLCDVCENNIANVCKLCGCFIPAKTRSREEECPIYKWKDSYQEDDNGNLFIVKALLPENLQEYFEEDYIEKEKWVEFIREK